MLIHKSMTFTIKQPTGKQIIHFLLLLLFSFATNGLWAQDVKIPDRPNPMRLVNDFANMLSVIERDKLERELVAYNDSTSTQIAVVTIQTLDGYSLDDYTQELGTKWGIGQKGVDNGVLILVVQKERKVRIATGAGIGVKLTAGRIANIIEYDIKPAFKQNRFYDGIHAAAYSIRQIALGEFSRKDFADQDSGAGWIVLIFILLFIVFIIFMIRRARRHAQNHSQYSSKRGYHDDSPPIIFWGGGGSSGWGGSSGGSDDSFSGFGGGDFDGGGASGDW